MANKTLVAALPNILRRRPPLPARWSRAFAVDPRSVQETPGSQVRSPMEEPANDESMEKEMEDALGSAREKAQLVKDAVEGRTENPAETIRENAEVVELAMNTKNRS
ncbi:hypothetical protein HPP92_012810 [Vanilla planifolia]|uniref:Uncharacterized protein n=1 Tax=Vanilla planifolia TaxID=51239 RepID=A0A835QNS3_VANPL|nr:hypothetical protein HPP92_012810 [Vanilla planifolia]